jgi:hydroxymethylpyrimidine pyrophosphatase-like HAD family hydrolase
MTSRGPSRVGRAVRLIAVDLDGTLLTSDGTPCPLGVLSLRRAAAAGVSVVLATTRNPNGAAEFAAAIGISGPMICTNGAQVWGSPTGPEWLGRSIPSTAVARLAQIADDQGWALATTVGSLTYWRVRSGMPLGPCGRHRFVVAQNAEGAVGDATRIIAFEHGAIEALTAVCQREYPDLIRAQVFTRPDGTPDSLVLTAGGTDKGLALDLVMERLVVEADEAMALGDNWCDLPMASRVGCFVAMGNAELAVREAAHVVAPTNDDAGVAWAVGRYALRARSLCP